MSSLRLLIEGSRVRATGIARGHSDLVVEVAETSLVTAAEDYLRYVAGYVEDQSVTLKKGETLPYGYWLTRFEEAAARRLEVWEYNPDATEFVRGATLTLTYWRDQHEVCRRFAAGAFEPPRPDRLVVVSEGVFEGQAVQGVRYSSPEHMSGWWITTDRYDGNVKSLKQEHLYHLTARRPDLAPYIPLPWGFRFDFTNREDVGSMRVFWSRLDRPGGLGLPRHGIGLERPPGGAAVTRAYGRQ